MFGIYYLLLDLDTDLTLYHPVMFVIKNCLAMDCLSCQIHAEKRIETDREKTQIYGRRIYTKANLLYKHSSPRPVREQVTCAIQG